MTNEKIIYDAAISAGIFTKESAAAILSTGRRLPLHTYQEWRRMGYQVKQGEHAAISVVLWRWKEGKKTGNVVEVPGLYNADGSAAKVEEQESSHHYKALAHLFTLSQVEKAAPAKVKTKEEILAYNRMLAEQRKARSAS